MPFLPDMIAHPLVSVVTPAYNGGPYVRECIESVSSQTYSAWEHIIVDNGSGDDTRDIVEQCAAREPRIRLFSNASTVPFVENWNRSMALMSAGSRYCKILHADDWMYPACLERMVELGERHASIGVIGALRLRGDHVECRGLPAGRPVKSGREVARLFLRQEVFGFAPTSSMVRSDLVRSRRPFYPTGYVHADLPPFFELLSKTDFGFIDEVLSFSRVHEGSITNQVAAPRRTLLREWTGLLETYGPLFFERDELEQLKSRFLRDYHRILVRGFFSLRERAFLEYHLEGLCEAGCSPTARDLIRAAATEARAALRRPDKVWREMRAIWRQRSNRTKRLVGR